MKTRHKLLLSVLMVWAQVFAPSLTGRAGGGSALMAQDAFYIYRNDGDFNGFFFDEVVRMGYSKFDLDSIEHDIYVVQEVETADSLYRIPLAAIDSVGFQQPEIKFNPKVKLMRESGLLPYVERAGDGWVWFKDLPDNLKPQIGDILIGLPTDETNEQASYGKDHEGFSCVVEYFETDKWNSHLICARGREVESINEVFEQFITLEDLGYDEQGNLVRRRVAGMPHREKGETNNINLVHLQGTIQKEWKPDENASISLAADVDVVFRVRLAYDIGWTRFFVKMTEELIIDATPSVSTSVSRGFNVALGNTVAGFGIPLRIWFPTECPIFELEPYPDWFIRGEGKIEAKFKFPKIHVGFGGDVIFDTNRLFPVDFGLHWVPEEDKNSGDLIDIGSTNVSLSGFVQTGLKFQVNIGTASWFKKVFKCQLGANIYAGPKIDGALEFSTDWLNNEGPSLSNTLYKSSINASWLSLDVEAGTTASVLWGDELKKTFYSASYPFFCDTLRFLPRLTPEIIVNDNNARVILRSMHDKVLGYNTFKVTVGEETIGDWGYKSDEDIYTGTYSFDGKKAGSHGVWLNRSWAGRQLEKLLLGAFEVPYTLEVDKNELTFDASGNQVLTIPFTTNAPKDEICVELPVSRDYAGEASFTAVSEAEGKYIASFKLRPNHFFKRKFRGYIIAGLDVSKRKREDICLIQERGDLSGVKAYAIGSIGDGESRAQVGFMPPVDSWDNWNVTLEWSGDNSIDVHGTYTNSDDNREFMYTITVDDYHISPQSGAYVSNVTVTNGTMNSQYSSPSWSSTESVTFGPVTGEISWRDVHNKCEIRGKVNSGRYDLDYGDKSKHVSFDESAKENWLELGFLLPTLPTQ